MVTEFDGKSFTAIGTRDPVLGLPVMQRMRQTIRGCRESMVLEVGHFVQEHVSRLRGLRWGIA